MKVTATKQSQMMPRLSHRQYFESNFLVVKPDWLSKNGDQMISTQMSVLGLLVDKIESQV